MNYQVAAICSGELLLIDETGKATSITSRFIADAEKREEKTNRLNSWKGDAQSWQPSLLTPEWSQLNPANRIDRKKMCFTNVTSDRGNIAYSVGMPGGGGLFRYDLGSKAETRLVHRNDFYPQGLSAKTDDGLLVFSTPEAGGTSSIVVGKRDGVHHVKLTTGDSRDEAPVWVKRDGKDYIYFHSMGLGRNAQGFLLGLAPAAIYRITYEAGDVETLLESKQFDYLQPRVNAQGELICVRRPYQASIAKPPSPATLLKDIVLFPLRLARAAYYFANFISVMFSGKPLAESHRDPSQPNITREMMLWGRVLDTQKQLRKTSDGRTVLAPADWELVKANPATGEAEVLHRGVLCFDLAHDGKIIYSDGSGIYEIDGQAERKLSDQKGVIQVAAICRADSDTTNRH